MSVDEHAPVGTVLKDDETQGVFLFHDEDTSVSQFRCSLEGITSSFVLDHFGVSRDRGSCSVTTLKEFNYHVAHSFEFQVRVTQTAALDLYATADVVVSITDHNNHAPLFSQSSYWFTVQKAIRQGTQIGKISVSDKDQGGNTKVILHLLSDGEQSEQDLSRLVFPFFSLLFFSAHLLNEMEVHAWLQCIFNKLVLQCITM